MQSGASEELTMAQNQSRSPEKPKTVRASVSFPSDVYEDLERIAKERKVSLAWVVREAAEKYLTERWPLLGR